MIESIRQLVGTPYVARSIDPEVGLDCMTCAALVYRLIGEALGEPDAWAFPMLRIYHGEGLMDLEELLGYWRNWTPADPAMGRLVVMRESHVGVQVDDKWVIHSRDTTGVVLSRRRTIAPLITGYLRLRQPGDPPPTRPPQILLQFGAVKAEWAAERAL